MNMLGVLILVALVAFLVGAATVFVAAGEGSCACSRGGCPYMTREDVRVGVIEHTTDPARDDCGCP